MALEDIINRIASDAEAESQQVRTGGSVRAGELLAAARAEAEQHHSRAIEQAKRVAASRAATVIASARLEARDRALSAKRELVNAALAGVVDAVEALPDDRYSRFLAAGIAESVRDGDVVAFAASDGRHVEAIREMVRAAAPDVSLEWDDAPAPVPRGALITGPRTHVQVTPAAVVDARRDELELNVATRLFSGEGS